MPSIFNKPIDSTSALACTEEILKRSMEQGFKWNDISGVYEKVEEELAEVKEAIASGNREHMKDEIGDLLFAVVKICAYTGINPDEALAGCNAKFIRRYTFMETYLAEKYKQPFSTLALEQMVEGWQAAKQNERAA